MNKTTCTSFLDELDKISMALGGVKALAPRVTKPSFQANMMPKAPKVPGQNFPKPTIGTSN